MSSTLYVDIPLVGGAADTVRECVRVHVDALPTDSDDIINVLRAEAAPLSVWLDVAKCYLAHGQEHVFFSIIQEAGSEEVLTHFITHENGRHDALLVRCTLAAYTIARFAELADDGASADAVLQRADVLAKATNMVARIRQDTYARNEQLAYIIEGQLALAKGDTKQAMDSFRMGMHFKVQGEHNNSCRLLLASLYYEQKDYRKSLTLYCQALRSQPDAPACIRLGIAACQWQLGNMTQSRAAYQRVLALDPCNVDAMLGMALHDLNSSTPEGLQAGTQRLQAAFATDPQHPLVCAALARLTLAQGDSAAAKQLAQAVLDTCDVQSVRASAATTLARALHAQGSLVEALKQYLAAQRLQPTAQLPRFGQAQILILRRDFANAAANLQVLLKEDPGWLDPLQLLWGLSSKAGAATLEASLPHFQAACRKDPRNPQLREMLGDVQVASNPAAALQCYEQAARLYSRRHRGVPENSHGSPGGAVNGALTDADNGALEDEVIEVEACPPRLLNNMAVLLLQAGASQRARELMAGAMALQASAMEASARAGTMDAHAALLQMTLAFNDARVLEACGEWHTAEERYMQAAGTYPDCKLRLALLAKRRGDLEGALAWVDKAEALPDLKTDAQCIKACIYVDMNKPDQASEWFKRVDAGAAASAAMDSYARVNLANLHLHSTSLERLVRKPDGSKSINKSEVDRLQRAFQRFNEVLTKEQGNAFAAHGLGCVLAEAGYMEAAKSIFLMVQEATAATAGFVQIPEAYINLGHTYIALQQPINAIRMYELALTKCSRDRSPAVLFFLARAHYEAKELDVQHILRAKDVLQRVLHLQPNNLEAIFDIAYCSQAYCAKVMAIDTPINDRALVTQMQTAVRELQAAKRTFSHLVKLSKTLGWATDKVAKHVEYIQGQAMPQAHAKLRKVEAAWEVYELKRKQAEAELLMKARERERAQAEAEARARAVREAQEAAAREAAAKQAAVLAKHKQERAVTAVLDDKGGKGKKRSRKGKSDDALMENDAAGTANAQQAAMEAAGLLSTSEDDDDYNPDAVGASPAPSSHGSDFEDGMEDDAEATPAGMHSADPPAAAGGSKRKRRRLSGARAAQVDSAMDVDLQDVEEDVVGAGSGGGRPRRAAAVLEDDDEDEEAGNKGEVGGLEDVEQQQGPEPGKDEGVAKEEADQGEDAIPSQAALFGDDDSDDEEEAL